MFWIQARLRVEEAKRAALEAERREAKEVAEREAIETSTRAAAGVAQEEAARSQMDTNSRTSNESKGFASDAAKKAQSASTIFFSLFYFLYLDGFVITCFAHVFSDLVHLRFFPSPDILIAMWQ